jgi:hypothetical protein
VKDKINISHNPRNEKYKSKPATTISKPPMHSACRTETKPTKKMKFNINSEP